MKEIFKVFFFNKLFYVIINHGKAQITDIYDDSNNLMRIKIFTICYQNTEKERNITDNIIKDICIKICKKYNIEIEKFLINPTGRFEIGGFEGDSGLTGRKIVVDTYQSFANVGGGAFSGKDPTKVDRSGAYKAREIAKKVVKSSDEYKWCFSIVIVCYRNRIATCNIHKYK